MLKKENIRENKGKWLEQEHLETTVADGSCQHHVTMIFVCDYTIVCYIADNRCDNDAQRHLPLWNQEVSSHLIIFI